MKLFKHEEMIRGWFVGDFTPTALQSKEFEVGIKKYKAGETEDAHVHKIAVELTMVIDGEIMMNDRRFTSGDIVLIEPGEVCSFKAIQDSTTVVVKSPSVIGDKYKA